MISQKRVKKTVDKPEDSKSETENFDINFKKMIKSIIVEEEYFRERDIKDLMESILKEIEPMIAKCIKEHFSEIAKHVVKVMSDPEPKPNDN